jgi:hypothetical protein
LYSTYAYGTIETDTQPNVKVMLGLTDTTTANANITTATITTLTATGLLYPLEDGNAPAVNQLSVMRTDGAGTLSFETINTDRIANATSEVSINANGSTDVTFNGNLVFTVIETGANVTGALNASTSVDSPTVNATTVLVTPKVSIGSTAMYSATATTNDVTPVVIAEVDSSTCRAVDFLVKGETDGKYTVATVTAIHNGTDVDFATHSKLHFNDIAAAGAFTVEMNGSTMQLKATPTTSAATNWVTQIRTV